jgi:hypothetical protein
MATSYLCATVSPGSARTSLGNHDDPGPNLAELPDGSLPSGTSDQDLLPLSWDPPEARQSSATISSMIGVVNEE